MKVIFIHPAHMDYRVELFERLNRNYDTTFVFTKQGRGQDNVNEKQQEIPKEWKSKVLKTNFRVGRKDVGMYFRLIRELLCSDYDVVLTSTSWYVCWIIAKIRRKKFVFMTEFWHWEDSSFCRKLLNKFTRLVSKTSDSIFAMGTSAYTCYRNFGVDKDKIFTHPQCAVDYSKNPTFDLRSKLGLQDKKIILYLGRVIERKGLGYLLNSLKMLEKDNVNDFLLVAGDGPDRNKYEKMVADLGLNNVLFVGQIEEKEKASYYNVCDLFVLPSIFYDYSYEPWGLVINEAMAFSKPVIATNAVGASLDMIKNEYNGFVVEEKNIEELYESIKKILSNEELMGVMGKNSRKNFEDKNNYRTFFETLNKSIEYTMKEITKTRME
ncbi:hypothetical protein MSSIT_3020 [Methanosarcina siciliae T4/M]|uniref:Glycosyl transferase family 1 domain-containing protein n=1 Tax=Methanosarcina siciliae T4/M TaxID=1434120 RepID=A0A0E3P778_9EURY|nr:glycosyltransferase family 4 protein [Methanosarcina siciliae]AKB29739.1 hypothetical protein MSSIT_3020 [Methanosarcina siciliae T4/M]